MCNLFNCVTSLILLFKLVDLERTTVQADTKVQGCWDKANEMRKKIVGYIEVS